MLVVIQAPPGRLPGLYAICCCMFVWGSATLLTHMRKQDLAAQVSGLEDMGMSQCFWVEVGWSVL